MEECPACGHTHKPPIGKNCHVINIPGRRNILEATRKIAKKPDKTPKITTTTVEVKFEPEEQAENTVGFCRPDIVVKREGSDWDQQTHKVQPALPLNLGTEISGIAVVRSSLLDMQLKLTSALVAIGLEETSKGSFVGTAQSTTSLGTMTKGSEFTEGQKTTKTGIHKEKENSGSQKKPGDTLSVPQIQVTVGKAEPEVDDTLSCDISVTLNMSGQIWEGTATIRLTRCAPPETPPKLSTTKVGIKAEPSSPPPSAPPPRRVTRSSTAKLKKEAGKK